MSFYNHLYLYVGIVVTKFINYIMEIKVGEVVWLKSGGPAMTVESLGTYSGGEGAVCTWFEEGRKSAVFMIASLTLTKPGSESK